MTDREKLEIYERNQERLIKALVKINRRNDLLEAQNTMYSIFLTEQQIKAADNFAAEMVRR